LDPSKGLLQLVRATAGLVERHPAFLLLVGDGPLREELQRLIVACRLSEHVRLAGARSDVPEILKIADLFVFPSRTEGLPNALLEAMAAGLPIAATDVPGCRDLIAHERTGLLTPYGDIDALGRAMARLLSQPSLARRLGETAAAEAASRWTLEQSLDGYAALYTEALSSGPATERPSGVHVG
jgi:glycosyltransferase involved in cell wall biosynthesis